MFTHDIKYKAGSPPSCTIKSSS